MLGFRDHSDHSRGGRNGEEAFYGGTDDRVIAGSGSEALSGSETGVQAPLGLPIKKTRGSVFLPVPFVEKMPLRHRTLFQQRGMIIERFDKSTSDDR